MTAPRQYGGADVLTAFVRAAGSTSLLAGLLVFIDWRCGFGLQDSMATTTANMKANTALCIAAAGMALRLTTTPEFSGTRALHLVLAFFPVLVGLLTLAEFALEVNLGIDERLAADSAGAPPGRMAPATAAALALQGIALLLINVHIRSAQLMALCALVIGMLGVLGFLFDATSVLTLDAYANMAPGTAMLILLVALGSLCARPTAGFVNDLIGPMFAGESVRRLIVWGPPVLMPLAWLRLQGEAVGHYGSGFGGALMIVLALGSLAITSWLTTRSMNHAHLAVLESEARYRGILESAVDAIVITNAAGRIVNVNPSTESLFGYARGELIGQEIEILVPERYRAVHSRVRSTHVERQLSGPMRGKNLFGLRKDGSEFFAEISISMHDSSDGVLTTSIVRDITQRKRHEEQLHYQANHDALTGLANREAARDHVRKSLADADQNQAVVLAIDLDHFKIINDSLGHSSGDHLLQIVAGRLNACAHDGDIVARMGADEFSMVLAAAPDTEGLKLLMGRIRNEIASPTVIHGQSLVVTCSIGAARFPFDGEDPETLFKHADTAMHRAKELGRNRFQFFTPEMDRRATERLSLESKLRRAVDNGELQLHYQPQVDLNSGQIVGAEALLRWFHPDLGMISAAKFIPLAEESGLIVAIGEWVLRTACAQNRRWQDAGFPPFRVAVNLSARQFREGHLARLVQDTLTTAGLAGSWLELEMTESLAMTEFDRIIGDLCAFKEIGVSTAMDDFGTGYSSLAYLKRFALDKLKIDKSFVNNIACDPSDATIVKTIIDMAHNLQMKVVAEGVETSRQLAYLCAHGCDVMQGFLFSRPLAAADFTAFLREGKRLALPSHFMRESAMSSTNPVHTYRYEN